MNNTSLNENYYVIVCTKHFTYMPVTVGGRHTPGPDVGTYAAWNEGDCDGPPGLAALYFSFTPNIHGAARFTSEKDAKETLKRMHKHKSDHFSVMNVTIKGAIVSTCR